MLYANPYKYTSDDILLPSMPIGKEYQRRPREKERAAFFSKASPVFATSPFKSGMAGESIAMKRGKLAMYGVEAEEYGKFTEERSVKKVKAMQSKRR